MLKGNLKFIFKHQNCIKVNKREKDSSWLLSRMHLNISVLVIRGDFADFLNPWRKYVGNNPSFLLAYIKIEIIIGRWEKIIVIGQLKI